MIWLFQRSEHPVHPRIFIQAGTKEFAQKKFAQRVSQLTYGDIWEQILLPEGEWKKLGLRLNHVYEQPTEKVLVTLDELQGVNSGIV